MVQNVYVKKRKASSKLTITYSIGPKNTEAQGSEQNNWLVVVNYIHAHEDSVRLFLGVVAPHEPTPHRLELVGHHDGGKLCGSVPTS